MSSGKLNIGLIDLYLSSCHNIKCGHLMDASNAVQCAKQWLLHDINSFTVKSVNVGGSFFVFVVC